MAKKPKAPVEPDTANPIGKTVSAIVADIKRPVGRPTKYDPAMLPIMEELAKQGASKAELTLAIGINRDTFHEWTRSNPEFSEAVKKCELHAQVWWEAHGRDGMTGKNPHFNATAFIFQVKNRFRGDYMDTSRTEVTGKDGGPVQMEAKVVDVDHLDDEQIALLEAALLSAKGKDE
jgi:hypothetical protein